MAKIKMKDKLQPDTYSELLKVIDLLIARGALTHGDKTLRQIQKCENELERLRLLRNTFYREVKEMKRSILIEVKTYLSELDNSK